jgi:NADPH-dependent curcumin reductase CurA
MSDERINRAHRLKARPEGRVSAANFDFVKEPVPKLGPNQALIRNLYLSLDPTMRIWMADVEQYMNPVQIGEVMRGSGIGEVIESTSDRFKVGELVNGLLGWQDYCVIDESTPMKPQVVPKGLPIPTTALLGAAGMTGLSAYFGLLDIGQPKEGETLVVSAAAGAVGSVVGQIGKIKGCRVVGIAGSDEKCALLKNELGFDEAVNYKAPDWKKKLKVACPNGIDIDFENVGGEIMNTVFNMLNMKARVVLCGLISGYNDGHGEKSRANLTPILIKRARIEGFIILDFAKRYAEGIGQLAKWIAEGKIKHQETIVDGLEQAPEAINKLFDGENIGKLIVKIADSAKA